MRCPTEKCRAVCCSFVPFERRFWKKNHRVIPDGVKLDKLPAPDGMVMYVQSDASENSGVCPFLNRGTYSCRIYDKRPAVCRKFGNPGEKHPLMHCHYLGQGDPRKTEAVADRVIKKITGGK